MMTNAAKRNLLRHTSWPRCVVGGILVISGCLAGPREARRTPHSQGNNLRTVSRTDRTDDAVPERTAELIQSIEKPTPDSQRGKNGWNTEPAASEPEPVVTKKRNPLDRLFNSDDDRKNAATTVDPDQDPFVGLAESADEPAEPSATVTNSNPAAAPVSPDSPAQFTPGFFEELEQLQAESERSGSNVTEIDPTPQASPETDEPDSEPDFDFEGLFADDKTASEPEPTTPNGSDPIRTVDADDQFPYETVSPDLTDTESELTAVPKDEKTVAETEPEPEPHPFDLPAEEPTPPAPTVEAESSESFVITPAIPAEQPTADPIENAETEESETPVMIRPRAETEMDSDTEPTSVPFWVQIRKPVIEEVPAEPLPQVLRPSRRVAPDGAQPQMVVDQDDVPERTVNRFTPIATERSASRTDDFDWIFRLHRPTPLAPAPVTEPTESESEEPESTEESSATEDSVPEWQPVESESKPDGGWGPVAIRTAREPSVERTEIAVLPVGDPQTLGEPDADSIVFAQSDDPGANTKPPHRRLRSENEETTDFPAETESKPSRTDIANATYLSETSPRKLFHSDSGTDQVVPHGLARLPVEQQPFTAPTEVPLPIELPSEPTDDAEVALAPVNWDAKHRSKTDSRADLGNAAVAATEAVPTRSPRWLLPLAIGMIFLSGLLASRLAPRRRVPVTGPVLHQESE